MQTVKTILKEAAERLRDAGIVDPVRESRDFLCETTGRSKAFLHAHPEYLPDDKEVQRFEDFVSRRTKREPFQHILGYQDFFGLEFCVTGDVLIPRHETEILVESAINLLKNQRNSRFLEIGTGSGCIAVTMLANLPDATALATDISTAALKVAALNSDKHLTTARLELIKSDLFNQIPEELDFDLIISNPPYIPLKDLDTLQPEVRSFDPHIALTDGDDGLSILNSIANRSQAHLRPGGYLLMEFGYGQSADVQSMFETDIWSDVEIVDDLQSIPRVVVAKKNG